MEPLREGRVHGKHLREPYIPGLQRQDSQGLYHRYLIIFSDLLPEAPRLVRP